MDTSRRFTVVLHSLFAYVLNDLCGIVLVLCVSELTRFGVSFRHVVSLYVIVAQCFGQHSICNVWGKVATQRLVQFLLAELCLTYFSAGSDHLPHLSSHNISPLKNEFFASKSHAILDAKKMLLLVPSWSIFGVSKAPFWAPLKFVAANRSLTVFHTLFHPSIVAVWRPARGERIGETQNAGPRHRHAFASPIQRVLPTNMTITIRMLVTMGLMCLQPQKLLLHFGPSKHSPPT